MKTYSNKSNAKRALKTFSAKVDQCLVASEVIEHDGVFGLKFQMASNAPAELLELISDFDVAVNKVEPVAGEFEHCPECGIHLSNGISDYATQCEVAAQNNSKAALIEHEYLCLACSNQFGNKVSKAKEAPKATGIKIQKDRDEKNGIKRPSEGGKCARLWEIFEAHYAETGMILTPKPAKELSIKEDLDPVTTTVQLYRWRDYMGF